MNKLHSDLVTLRTIGPFSDKTLPPELMRGHDLKAGGWTKLEVLAGKVRLLWDEGGKSPQELHKDDEAIIPPHIKHHLELIGPVQVAISFLSEEDQ